MANFTETLLQNFTDVVTKTITLLPNETSSSVTLSNVTFSNEITIGPSAERGHGGQERLSGGYYQDTMETLWKVVPPIIIVWGILGNSLTAMVLVRQMTRKVTSTSIYLLALAFFDSVILLCGPLRNFIKFNWEIDVRNFTDAGCRVQLYFTYASVHTSSWLLVAVTMERVLSVVLPHKVKLGCTTRIAGIVIIVTCVCTFALNICVAVINGHDTQVKSYRCAPTSNEYQEFRDNIWNWIDFLIAFAIPFVFLLVGNVVIIVNLCRSIKRKRQMSTSQVASSKTISISVLLILLCFVFFATMTPVSVFLIYQPYRLEEIQDLPTFKEAWYAYHYMTFQHAVVNIVGYTNASFNFLMYVLSGSKFRNDLKQIICFCFKKPPATGQTCKYNTTKTTNWKSSSLGTRTSQTCAAVTTSFEGNNTVAHHSAKESRKNGNSVDDDDKGQISTTDVQIVTVREISEENISQGRACP